MAQVIPVSSSELTRAKLSPPKDKDFVDLLQRARQAIRQGQGEPLTVSVRLWSSQGYRVFGMNTACLTPKTVRASQGALFQAMGYPASTQTLQLIGDSANFDPKRVAFAQALLCGWLQQ